MTNEIESHQRPTATSSPARLPAQDCDLLQGIAQIASWRGITSAQCRRQIEDGMIPAYRLPGKSTVYAFKSEMVETARRLLVKGAVPNKHLHGRKKVAPL